MIACGIEIKGSEAVIVILGKLDNKIENLTGEIKKVKLDNDTDCRHIKSFFTTICQHFNAKSPDRIGVITRNKKGTYSGGAVSFKIETLLQLYPGKNVTLVSPLTIKAYYKKNQIENILNFNKYQKEAYKLAYYLLNK
ncbi:MAG: DUF3010 family protein [Candidatus Omnitrophota bacterium]